VTEEAGQQIRAPREKARQALSDAELPLEDGSGEAATNRGHNAAFQAARAALLTQEEGLPPGRLPSETKERRTRRPESPDV
jgi:hypothetical protein